MKTLLHILSAAILCFALPTSGYGNTPGTTTHDQTTDWSITKRVKAEIAADTQLSFQSRSVAVSTKRGVVTLSGHVASQAEMDHLINLVKSVNGVTGVNNNLTVKTP